MLRITPIDDAKVNDGTWTNYRGVDLCIARGNNDRFLATFRRLSKPYRRELRNGTLDPKIDRNLVIKALAEAVLIDWKPFRVAGMDEPVVYSKEAAINLLTNDPDCREFVSNFSQDLNNYLTSEDEEEQGNS